MTLRTPRASASRRGVLRRVAPAGLAVVLAAGLAVSGGAAARAEAGNGTGSGGDGSLHLIPEVITNAGIKAGGSSDFPVKARLFLPEMTQRAQELSASSAAVVHSTDALDFQPHPNPYFEQDFASVRKDLFAGYSPQPVSDIDGAGSSAADLVWYAVMLGALVPLTLLAVVLGRRTATRRLARNDRPAH